MKEPQFFLVRGTRDANGNFQWKEVIGELTNFSKDELEELYYAQELAEQARKEALGEDNPKMGRSR